VALLKKRRLAKSSWRKPIFLISACMVLSRLSVLMTRLRASTTSLRSSCSSRPSAAGGKSEGREVTRGWEVVSSLI
jgi:hypothetical protein